MEFKINVVIESTPFKHMNCYSMRITAIINGVEFGFLKAIPIEAEADYFDYIWDDVGEFIKKEYLEALKKDFQKEFLNGEIA